MARAASTIFRTPRPTSGFPPARRSPRPETIEALRSPGCIGGRLGHVRNANGERNRTTANEAAMREATERAFLSAFLLSGSTERAEAAVLEGIASLDSDDATGEPLLQATVCAAVVEGNAARRRTIELEPFFWTLPFELQCVMHLPQDLRQCFVLRILGGLPREACASLLGCEIDQIDQNTCTALVELSALKTAVSERNELPALTVE